MLQFLTSVAFPREGDHVISSVTTYLIRIYFSGMMPFWLYTLGKEFYTEYDLSIPYIDILVTLSVILVPLSVGLFIKNKFPKMAGYIEKIITFVLTILALMLIVTGVYSNLYIFRLFSAHVILIGCALPYIGFIIGGIIASFCKQTPGNIKTIAIETGLQNTGIAMILLLNSFPEPMGDLSSIAPIAAEVMSPIPPLIIAVVYLIYKKCCTKSKDVREKQIQDETDIELNVCTEVSEAEDKNKI